MFEISEEILQCKDLLTKAIYVIRNPLDMFLSVLNFVQLDVKNSLSEDQVSICFKNFINTGCPIASWYEGGVGSWQGNYASWLLAYHKHRIPLHLIQYEQLKKDPGVEFSKCIRFLMDGDVCEEKLQGVIESNRLDKLRKKEQELAKNEGQEQDYTFFNQGKSFQTLDHLDSTYQEEYNAKYLPLLIENPIFSKLNYHQAYL